MAGFGLSVLSKSSKNIGYALAGYVRKTYRAGVGRGDTGHRTQDTGHRTQDTGHRTQDTGHGTELYFRSQWLRMLVGVAQWVRSILRTTRHEKGAQEGADRTGPTHYLFLSDA